MVTRAQLSEPPDQSTASAEKIITENGEGYVAVADPHRPDYYHRLEKAHIHPFELSSSASATGPVMIFEWLKVGQSRQSAEQRPMAAVHKFPDKPAPC